MTITLCGFTLSNYYNKVKMVLLEKGLPFTEVRIGKADRDEAMLAASPVTSAMSWPMSTVSSSLIFHALNVPAKEASTG